MMSSNRIGTMLVLAFSIALTAGFGWQASAKTETLNQQKIEKFCESFPKVKALAIKHGKEKGAEVATATDRLAAVLKLAKGKDAAKEVTATIQAHGFADVKEWASVGESIVKAYAHIKTGGAPKSAQKKLDKAIRKIEKNPILSDKQKADLIKAIRDGAEDVLEPPPAENVAAVKPMVGKIEAVMQ